MIKWYINWKFLKNYFCFETSFWVLIKNKTYNQKHNFFLHLYESFLCFLAFIFQIDCFHKLLEYFKLHLRFNTLEIEIQSQCNILCDDWRGLPFWNPSFNQNSGICFIIYFWRLESVVEDVIRHIILSLIISCIGFVNKQELTFYHNSHFYLKFLFFIF